MKDIHENNKKQAEVLRGELWISPQILEAFDYEKQQNSYINVAIDLGARYCFFSSTNPFNQLPESSQTLQQLVLEAHQRNLACGITVDGPFERMCRQLGFMEALTLIHDKTKEGTQNRLRLEAQKTMAELDSALSTNPNLLILCDDIAYANGLFFSPSYYEEFLYPLYSEFAAKVKGRVPLGFHSDGDLSYILPSLIQLGYRFFSLEPEAMDLPELKKDILADAVIIGGIKSEWLINPLSNPQEVQDYVTKLAENAGLIWGSTCGLYNVASIPLLQELYRILDEM